MKFEQLLNHFDTGICVDQMQKEALIDIAILFIGVDGVICESEKHIVRKWAKSLQWNSAIDLDSYIEDSLSKSVVAIKNNDIEAYVQHRMNNIVDEPMRKLAKDLAIRVIEADGNVKQAEKEALAILEAEL
ncbi:hypothetical protein HUZ36_04360 [Pseudoalteromonas sp. McH1-7]|uniref:Co-chaperone DjlA N-terminal domain-containing protein n=1 Tax=Pseudoalteromonas peptidolytica F12-50-A1 TaxID=1315280 RepID=A0A8I0N040_9GAMM|nr:MULTISPECIES: hypothetical protein [Pseudoalteromonas]MBE0348463.1 hypothetical protein [Pseudoalteromonas peptidolytica F12-50-A1]NLR15051.1 hypothetical protein [Pseudoalteromonas peptidolytica]NUZ10005.1 hypothetical protein [Pseudoalteromonas sp. McH1-7]RXF03305.1 hypothetical protein D9603_08355 [Pseudoalteromonas sp. PS5]USD30927.1 hypothetical protein J8Z24_18375 [Pseudoalteromonas sp. SCSIO 43201]